MVDVAREAGVALRTVSRVANNDPTVGPANVAGLTLLAASTDFDETRERDIVMMPPTPRRHVVEPIGESHRYLEPELAAGMPMVSMDRPMSGISVDCVMSDNASGIGTAFHHLHGHGHHRIAYLGDSERVGAAGAGRRRTRPTQNPRLWRTTALTSRPPQPPATAPSPTLDRQPSTQHSSR